MVMGNYWGELRLPPGILNAKPPQPDAVYASSVEGEGDAGDDSGSTEAESGRRLLMLEEPVDTAEVTPEVPEEKIMKRVYVPVIPGFKLGHTVATIPPISGMPTPALCQQSLA